MCGDPGQERERSVKENRVHGSTASKLFGLGKHSQCNSVKQDSDLPMTFMP